MRRNVIIAILLIMAVLACFTGCKRDPYAAQSRVVQFSPEGLTGDDLAFSRFTQPIDVRIGMSVDPTDSSLPPGDTPENNQYTRHLREVYNINVIVEWTAANGPDFNSKLALCIASDTLPDAVVSPNHIYMLKAAKSGMLYDLSDIFEQYQSSQVRKIMESTNNRAKASVTHQGRMVGLPNVTVVTDGITIMGIQKNWLDMYGLEVPRTLDEIENVARVFRDRRPAGNRTVPIIGPDKGGILNPTFIESSGIANGFGPIFSAYDAYPGFFLDNGDGTVSYGSLSPNMRPALERLNRWYREGLLDPEIGSRDNSWELINANQGGIVFGPWWTLGYGTSDSFRNNPNVNWQAYPVYTDDGKWNSTIQAVGKTATLVSRRVSADVAAAVVIMYNVLVRDEGVFDTTMANFYPLRNIAAIADETEYEYHELTKVLMGITEPEDYNDPYSPYKLMYSDALVARSVIPGFSPDRELSIRDFNQSDRSKFNRLYALMIGNRPFSTVPLDKAVTSVTYAMTDLLEQRWSNLYKMEQEVFLKIITGQLDISAFDKFVNDWKNQGGQGILDDLAKQFLE